MTKRLQPLLFIIFVMLNFSCSKYEVHTNNTIDVEHLNIENLDTDLDIIHLTADSADFGYMIAYAHEDIVIDAAFNMFINRQAIINNKSIELKVKGTSTVWYDLKSLKIKFVRKVNNEQIPIIQVEKLLPGHHLEELKKISLRNSGNDFLGTFIKDITYTELAIQLGLNMELSYYKPVQVFVNNKYYGLLNIRTEKDDNSLGKLLEVDNEDVNILKISHMGDEKEILEVGSGDSIIIQDFIDAVHSKDLDYLLKNIDLPCFADYIVFEDFIGNSDWPFNNVEIYNVGPHGKFRFFLFDLDFAADMDKYFIAESDYNGFLKQLYDILLTNSEFRTLVKERQIYIYNHAHPALFREILNKNAHRIENEIVYNIAKYEHPNNLVMWYYELQRLQEKFETRRKLFKWYYQMD